MVALGTSKAKVEEKDTQLKLELEQTVSRFTKEKIELDVAYQQQVDDMFFYDYRCCMGKHNITDNIPSIPSEEEDEAILGKRAKQENDWAMGNGFATTNHDDQDTAWDCCFSFSFLSFGHLGLSL